MIQQFCHKAGVGIQCFVIGKCFIVAVFCLLARNMGENKCSQTLQHDRWKNVTF
jgi:hypothetical protein